MGSRQKGKQGHGARAEGQDGEVRTNRKDSGIRTEGQASGVRMKGQAGSWGDDRRARQ